MQPGHTTTWIHAHENIELVECQNSKLQKYIKKLRFTHKRNLGIHNLGVLS